jgi:hypothetical protein
MIQSLSSNELEWNGYGNAYEANKSPGRRAAYECFLPRLRKATIMLLLIYIYI